MGERMREMEGIEKKERAKECLRTVPFRARRKEGGADPEVFFWCSTQQNRFSVSHSAVTAERITICTELLVLHRGPPLPLTQQQPTPQSMVMALAVAVTQMKPTT